MFEQFPRLRSLIPQGRAEPGRAEPVQTHSGTQSEVREGEETLPRRAALGESGLENTGGKTRRVRESEGLRGKPHVLEREEMRAFLNRHRTASYTSLCSNPINAQTTVQKNRNKFIRGILLKVGLRVT